MKKKFALATTAASIALVGASQFVYAAEDFSTITTPSTGYATSFSGLISFVLRIALAIGALLVFGYLILGGIEYITSGGEKGKTEAARNKITAAVVGLIILAASWAILNLALGFLGFDNLGAALKGVGTIKGAP